MAIQPCRVLFGLLFISTALYLLPPTEASTCQCTCSGRSGMGGMMPMGAKGPAEIDEIDNSGIPGWGPSCVPGTSACPTHRPLTPTENTAYQQHQTWEQWLADETTNPGK